jgi:hypothetical protein
MHATIFQLALWLAAAAILVLLLARRRKRKEYLNVPARVK